MARYGGEMGELANKSAPGAGSTAGDTPDIEAILKDALAKGDRALSGVTPVLTHLLANTGDSLVSDAIVARIRGMLSDISAQLVLAARTEDDPVAEQSLDRFAEELHEDSAVLSHCYALAVEGYLGERFEQRAKIDQVLTPLLQELIASDQPAVGELAMECMAAQSRFVQSQRRMQLPLGELPAELFFAILRRWENHCRRFELAIEEASYQSLRQRYDEGTSRMGQFARLVSAMRGGIHAALDLKHAGLALFASAVSAATRQPRELAVLACHERQTARLALTLRAANLDADAIEKQILLVESAERLPSGLETISPQRASALLGHATTDQVI